MSDDALRNYYRAILPYYDESLRDRGDLPFWEAIAAESQPRSILELGCGTGRVTAALRRQAPTTGVDALPEMLAVARRKLRDVTLVAADLRALPLRGTFDLIVLADDPLAHVTAADERAEVMAWIAEHLSKDGQVIVEGLHRPRPVASTAHDRLGDGEEALVIEERWTPLEGAAQWEVTYRYSRGGAATTASARLRSWSEDDLTRMRAAGLRVENVWGDFDRRPFHAQSPRILVTARTERAN